MLAGGGCQHGRGQRRDRGRQAEAQDRDRGQYRGEILPPGGDPGEQRQPGADQQRADGQLQTRTDAARTRAPERADSPSIMAVIGRRAMPASSGL